MNLDHFEIHLVEHCNLKCQCCDNFSSIAEKEFVSEDSFKNDMERMSTLFNVELIRLLGGEPLLHPNLTFFLKTARQYFNTTEIRLTTNGILLNKMPKEFWVCCKENNIIIEVTYYPINIDREQYKKIAKEYNVKITAFFDYDTDSKTSWRFPISEIKNKDIKDRFNNCKRNNCYSLKNGNLYTCTCIPNICHFNKYFNKKLEITELDYINIYEHNAEEIIDFLNKPVPFCGYCNTNNNSFDLEWKTTNYDINEWYDK